MSRPSIHHITVLDHYPTGILHIILFPNVLLCLWFETIFADSVQGM